MGPSHDFIPVGLHTYDGLADSDDPARPNTTFPVLSLRTIMTSYDHPKVDVLRLKISSAHEWKVLKNLVNTGVLSEIRQLSINLRMDDRLMWEEYKTVLTGVRSAGFHPYYVTKQTARPTSRWEGSQGLYSAYEVTSAMSTEASGGGQASEASSPRALCAGMHWESSEERARSCARRSPTNTVGSGGARARAYWRDRGRRCAGDGGARRGNGIGSAAGRDWP